MMTSQEQAAALRELDRLYEQKDSFRIWLSGNQQSQGDYDVALRRLEVENPGLVVKRADLTYRVGHVLAPED
jgi:hypothetical protein